jgi:hypothetical protein
MIVPTNALEHEIEPVRDLPIAPASAVDRHLAIDPVPREHHHPADRVADCPERFVFFLGEQPGDAPHRNPSRERGNDCVATKDDLAEFRAVMQVHAADGFIVLCSTGACGIAEEWGYTRQGPFQTRQP